MGVFLNKKINNIEKIKYDNNLKTYSGVLNNSFETKIINGTSNTFSTVFSTITSNHNNGFTIGFSEIPVSTGNNVITCDDGGDTWNTSYRTSEQFSFNSVIFANNKYIAVGNQKIIFSINEKPLLSSDWTAVTGIASNNWSSITFGNGYYVAVSQNGTPRVIVSEDGISWSSKNIDPNKEWKFITYSPDLKIFVAFTDSFISYSYFNGNSWILSSVLSGSWISAAWSSKLKKFIAVANSGTNRMMTSIDGIIWSVIPNSIVLSYKSIIWVQELELFIAISDLIIITSPDGENWTYRKSPSTGYAQIIWNRYYGNLIIISSNATSSKIIINKNLGINSLLSTSNYYEILDFKYSVLDFSGLVGDFLSINSNLNDELNFTYSIFPELPNGLSINLNTGEIKGTSSNPLLKTKFEVTATSSNKILKTYIFISISGVSIPLKNFYYIVGNLFNVTVNSIINLIPNIVGTKPITYEIIGMPNLPENINLDPNTGVISGISNLTFSSNSYVIRASNPISSIDNVLTIKTNDVFPSDFYYNNGLTAILFVEQNITYNPQPINTGTNLSYSISPLFSVKMPLLTISSSTGVISGTIPSTTVNETYLITASNNNGEQIKTTIFNINVIDIFIISFYYNNISGVDTIETYNNALIDITPTKNGGSNVNWNISTSLINGYSFFQSSGRIYGTNFSAPNTDNFYFSKTYEITASNNSNSIKKNIIINNTFQATLSASYFKDPSDFEYRGFNSGNWGSITLQSFNTFILSRIYVYGKSGWPYIFYTRFSETTPNRAFNVTNLNINKITLIVSGTTYNYFASQGTPYSSSSSAGGLTWSTANGFTMPYSPAFNSNPPLITVRITTNNT